MPERTNLISEMNDRSREVFRRVVEGYLENGDPVGSRSLTRTMNEKVSAATIRNVMSAYFGRAHSDTAWVAHVC
jgi:heat-inducible transcriptional repressor